MRFEFSQPPTLLFNTNAVACCRMRSHMQPGTPHSVYARLRQTCVAYSQQCFGILSHLFGTFHSAYAGVLQASAAYSQHCCGMLLHAVHMQLGTILSAYAGLRQASAAYSRQCSGTPGTIHSAYAGLRQASAAQFTEIL